MIVDQLRMKFEQYAYDLLNFMLIAIRKKPLQNLNGNAVQICISRCSTQKYQSSDRLR